MVRRPLVSLLVAADDLLAAERDVDRTREHCQRNEVVVKNNFCIILRQSFFKIELQAVLPLTVYARKYVH